jgi:glycosyltransferase involved in cell wall biosynthesis
MRKLLVLPGDCDTLGGTLVSLSLLIKGFERCSESKNLRVFARCGSFLEKYLREAGQGSCLQIIQSQNQTQFVKHALQWVIEQPRDWPLLLDNCVDRRLMPMLMLTAPALRLSRRPVYHFCHDLALSYNPLGYLIRKLAFTSLSPVTICNSQFTAEHIGRLMNNVRGILYQPIDPERFNDQPPLGSPPIELQTILRSGARVILTPSRLNRPGIVNDKNLQALIPLLAHLKANGHLYHGVVIGEDRSPNQVHTRALLENAELSKVADRLTILPPTFAIEDYYKYADVVVTLAPREPFGRTVIEAIACSVPVVGSRTGGIGEILNHFAPEWTVDPNDPVAAAETIVRIAADPNTSNVLAQGKSWVKTQCSVLGYARGIMEITGLAPTGHALVEPQLSRQT